MTIYLLFLALILVSIPLLTLWIHQHIWCFTILKHRKELSSRDYYEYVPTCFVALFVYLGFDCVILAVSPRIISYLFSLTSL